MQERLLYRNNQNRWLLKYYEQCKTPLLISHPMNLYIPKIIIMQQPGTDKPGFENDDGELLLMIENDFTDPAMMDDQDDNYPGTTG